MKKKHAQLKIVYPRTGKFKKWKRWICETRLDDVKIKIIRISLFIVYAYIYIYNIYYVTGSAVAAV